MSCKEQKINIGKCFQLKTLMMTLQINKMNSYFSDEAIALLQVTEIHFKVFRVNLVNLQTLYFKMNMP